MVCTNENACRPMNKYQLFFYTDNMTSGWKHSYELVKQLSSMYGRIEKNMGVLGKYILVPFFCIIPFYSFYNTL